MSSHQVFISHAASDREWVRAFAAAMRDLGVNVWFDEFNIGPGDSIPDSLERALRDSEIVVLPITRETVHNSNFLFELGAAMGMNKRIVPVVSEDVDYSRLPLSLSRVSVLKQGSPKDTAEEMVRALKIPRDEAA